MELACGLRIKGLLQKGFTRKSNFKSAASSISALFIQSKNSQALCSPTDEVEANLVNPQLAQAIESSSNQAHSSSQIHADNEGVAMPSPTTPSNRSPEKEPYTVRPAILKQPDKHDAESFAAAGSELCQKRYPHANLWITYCRTK
jgi:hypothetical protein